MNRLNTAIFISDGVEVLDFAGPFEVFSRTRLVPGVESRRSDASAPFNVFTVARLADTVHATGGLRVLPHFDFAGAPPIDLLVIPGGFRHAPTPRGPRCSRVDSERSQQGEVDHLSLYRGAAARESWSTLGGDMPRLTGARTRFLQASIRRSS